MRQKEIWAQQYLDSIKDLKIQPFLNEIWIAGFMCAKDKLLDLCDAKNQMVTFTEINRLGEKNIKENKQ